MPNIKLPDDIVSACSILAKAEQRSTVKQIENVLRTYDPLIKIMDELKNKTLPAAQPAVFGSLRDLKRP